jgi:secondary thiamine-phosphate synthase enzyme
MKLRQTKIIIETPGRGFVDITDEIKKNLAQSMIVTGLCHIFIQHTSASLCINENYDPLVRRDLEAFMVRLVPDGDPIYQHIEEGPDDMPSHVRSLLTTTFLSIPITEGKLALGQWQAIYLWEHRLRSYKRNLIVTLQGE